MQTRQIVQLYCCASTPCSSLMRSYSAEGEQLQCVANNCNALRTIAMHVMRTIAMRCEQLQYDSSTNARNFTVHCIPCKSHYALAWGALMHCAHVATYLQYKMYNTSKASIAYIYCKGHLIWAQHTHLGKISLWSWTRKCFANETMKLLHWRSIICKRFAKFVLIQFKVSTIEFAVDCIFKV